MVSYGPAEQSAQLEACMVAISDAFSHALLDAAPDAIVGLDVDGRVCFANEQAQRLFGYGPADLLAQPLQTFLPVDLQTLRTRGDCEDRSCAQRARGRIELIGRRRDRSEFAAEVTLSEVDSADGVVTMLAIRERGERTPPVTEVRRLLEAAPDATVIVNREGLISRVNRQLETLFGYESSEVVGQPVELLVAEAGSALCAQFETEAQPADATGPRGWRAELTGRRKDGTEFPAEISAIVFDSFAGPVVTASVRDITERVESTRARERLAALLEQDQLRAQLAQSQRLESLGQLAGGIAHDFNNLLGVIQNYAAFVGETLSTRAQDFPADSRLAEARIDIEQIQSAAERAARLARRLLAFARRETIQPEVIDLNALVRDIELLLTHTIGEHVSLKTELDPELPPIEADRGQIEQILVNLTVNARDAMPDGGTVTIDTAAFLVDGANAECHPTLEPGHHVRLRVSDTGTGMSAEVLDRAFDPFFTTKPTGEGSGLGLATVYGIVTQSDGSVRLSSELGVGTTVTVLLRAATAPVAAGAEDPSALPPHTPRAGTVLIVEDDASLREVARRILKRNGYRVLVASSAARALEIASDRTNQISLLLTDVVMPVMGGYELAQRFGELSPLTPVLYMSGYAEPAIATHSPPGRPRGLVTKPFVESALLAAIHAALGETTNAPCELPVARPGYPASTRP